MSPPPAAPEPFTSVLGEADPELDGRLSAELDFRHARRLRLTVVSATGRVVLRRTGRPVLSDTAMLTSGRYRLRVSGPGGARYTVRISRVAP